MKTLFRLAAAFVSAVATFYFVFWVAGALLFQSTGSAGSFWGSMILSAVAGCLVAWFVWRQTASVEQSLVTAVVLGAFLTGAIGFSIGFFGPIVFTPEANQGPLLGIFITGPLGFLLGGGGGAVWWFLRRKARMAGG